MNYPGGVVLVVGCAGYIGNQVRRLIEEKNQVIVLDDLSTVNMRSADGALLVVGRMSDSIRMGQVFAQNTKKVLIVMHFAASCWTSAIGIMA